MKPKIILAGDGHVRNILGDNQTVKLSSADTGGAFVVFEQSNGPGVGIPLHVHQNEDELFYVVEGSIHFKVEGQSVVAGAGATVFLPRGVPHEFMTVGDAPAKTFVTVFPAGIEDMFGELSALPAGPPDMVRVFEVCANHGITFLSPPAATDDAIASV